MSQEGGDVKARHLEHGAAYEKDINKIPLNSGDVRSRKVGNRGLCCVRSILAGGKSIVIVEDKHGLADHLGLGEAARFG